MRWYSTSQFQITPNCPQLLVLSSSGAQQRSKGRSRTHGAVTHNTDWRLMLKDNSHTIVGRGKRRNPSKQSSHMDCFGFPLLPILLTCFFPGLHLSPFCLFFCFLYYLLIYSSDILGSKKPMLLKESIFLQLGPVVSKLTQGTWTAILEQDIFNKKKKSLKEDTEKALLVFTTMSH